MTKSAPGRLSIIIPILNEGRQMRRALQCLQPLRCAGHELIVVDGGSGDGSVQQMHGLVDQVLVTRPGRAHQMNAGAAMAGGDVLLFLHADTRLPAGAVAAIFAAVGGARVGAHHWGRFDVQLTGTRTVFRVIALMMNWRSRLTGIATGDQAIFVRRSSFEAAGGYPEQPLMEDVALSKRLKALSSPASLTLRASTSSRRWQRNGILTTILLMWFLRLAYFLGASPHWLHRLYYGRPSQHG